MCSRPFGILLSVLWVFLGFSNVHADVDVSLNLRYEDPADVTEGGTWTLVSKTNTVNSNGISNLVARYSDIDAAGTVDPNVGHNILGGLLGVTPIGGDVEFEYGQDTNQTLTLNVGQLGGPSDIGLDPLGDPVWNNASIVATGTFSSSRPAAVSASVSEFDGASSNAVIPATIGSHVVRGDSIASQGQGDSLLVGDTDRDGDVDSGDITTTYANFTGAGNQDPLVFNETWETGDFNDDGDVDSPETFIVLANYTGNIGFPGLSSVGPLIPNNPSPANPILIYNHTNGEVALDANGQNLLSFFLQSDGLFNAVAEFSGLDVGFPFSLKDNTVSGIGWVSGNILNNGGFSGPQQVQIGSVLPIGLDLTELEELLFRHDWAGPGGMGGRFDLTIVPEPTALTLLSITCLGLYSARHGGRKSILR